MELESSYPILLAGVSLDLPRIRDPNGKQDFFVLDIKRRADLAHLFAADLHKKLAADALLDSPIITVSGKCLNMVDRMAINGRYAIIEKEHDRKPYYDYPYWAAREQSMTTRSTNNFYLRDDDAKWLKGQMRNLVFVDDVLSTASTADAVIDLCEQIGRPLAAIAVVLVEGERRTEYRGIPVISLGYLPLPHMP
ncbi:MAG: hypothetical protein LBM12_01000 [Candidatus Nomurabacteria bacterium]|jgi:adenine phosphoribosyltransferase|nr:hypothetical protein [Candidatus Nomurabacteria bacterium]